MNLARIVAFVLFVAGAFCAFGWVVDQSVPHAVGLVALGLAIDLLATVPAVTVQR